MNPELNQELISELKQLFQNKADTASVEVGFVINTWQAFADKAGDIIDAFAKSKGVVMEQPADIDA